MKKIFITVGIALAVSILALCFFAIISSSFWVAVGIIVIYVALLCTCSSQGKTQKFVVAILFAYIGIVALYGLAMLLILILPVEKLCLSKLDRWVASTPYAPEIHALPPGVNETVISECESLVLATAGRTFLPILLWDSEERNYRVEFCIKATINQVYPQPEFQKPEILNAFCAPQKTKFFELMRNHFGFCTHPSRTGQ